MWGGHGGSGGYYSPPPTQGGGQPFAGIPSELLENAEKFVAKEPEPRVPEVEFSHVMPSTRPFSLAQLLAPKRAALVLAIVLVALETFTLQIGPLLTQKAIDDGVLERDNDVVVQMALLFIAAIVANTVIGAVRLSWTGRLGQTLMRNLRIRVFSHIQRLSLDFYTDEKAGRIMTRMTSDIEALSELLQDGIVNLIVQGFTLVMVTAIMFSLNAQLAAVTLFVILPVLGVLTLWFRSASERGYATVRERIADVMADLQENLSGIRILTAYNRQRFNTVKHRNIVGDHMRANEYAVNVASHYGPGSEAIGLVGQALILLIGGNMVLDGTLSVGELTAFVLYLAAFFAPIQQLVQLYNSYQSGQAAVAKLRELFAVEPSVAEKPDAVALPPIEGEVRLVQVTFGYSPDLPVLHDVDLVIPAGETFALVGPTGAGKSTIAKLVARFYDPLAGRVLVDGTDLRDVQIASLRRQLGVVPQEPFLFAGSIRDNVAFARPEASEAEVMVACRAVGLADLVARLAAGIDTPVFERGSSLSSGERQLLALARAFLAQPRVLILDEATSSLDLRSEAVIEHALDVVLEGRTAIIIAHRLSTAMRAQRIGVIDDGKLIELGSHAELVVAGGKYAEMYATWVQHMTDEVAI